MNHDERHQRMVERLEKRQAELLARLNERQERMNKRLEQQQARMHARIERNITRTETKISSADEAIKLNDKQQLIIRTALDLLTEKGLNELSLREIAKRLHMQAPALYWHFKNKEVLVDFMAEAILQKEFGQIQTRTDDQPWQAWLTNHMLTLRRAMLAYPDGARVVAGAHPYPAITLGKTFESALQSLHSTGLPLLDAARIVMTATTYTFGYVIEEQSSPSSEELKSFDFTYFSTLAPLTTKLVQQKYGNDIANDSEKDYLAGLQLIIAGATA